MEPTDADVVLVGGGGAAVCVLHRLALARRDGPSGRHPPLRVVVVDPLDRLASTPDDRTWSFWERVTPAPDAFAFADPTLSSLLVAGPDRVVEVDLAPTHRYRTLRSSTFYRAVRDLVADPAAWQRPGARARSGPRGHRRRGRCARGGRHGAGACAVGPHLGAAPG